MDEATARARLERLVDAGVEPILDSIDVDMLLDLCRLADSEGLAPTDPDWTPTWDLNRGAAAGWTLKASRAARTGFDVDADGTSMSLSQRVEQFERLAKEYRRKIITSIHAPAKEYPYDWVE